MRARNIKPAFFKNDTLAECSDKAKLLFIGLWMLADREGRLENRPRRIKAEIFPYDECNIEGLLEELISSGFVFSYSVHGSDYLSIPAFTKHQNCHIREAASTIPAPCKHQSSTVLAGPLTESLLLNPESPTPSPEPSGASTGSASVSVSSLFEIFWNAYPKQKSKGDAKKAFQAVDPNEQLLEAMIAKIEQAKTSEDWLREDGRFIPYPAKWLNSRGWEDETHVSGIQKRESRWFSGVSPDGERMP